ncbi:hypothetical protein CFIO01_11534 [Colletotrichum fioriniae PJ7]|uniref:Uncharacterized protein n=1 Tax=Colletotrichum fioriniae PJ7 TaxID=1445577 RepID=A0A010QVJ4_9PEZI|nr:hypothetical protein CFIO01_11534 [Colletotrichum fioriniae PJ7]
MPVKDLQTEGAQKDQQKSEHEEKAVYDDADWEHGESFSSLDIDGGVETVEEECTEDKEASPPRRVSFETPERRWQGLRRQEDEAKWNAVSELMLLITAGDDHCLKTQFILSSSPSRDSGP